MEREQASKFINDLLRLLVSRNGSDLFITAEFPPAIKVDGKITKVSPQMLEAGHTMTLARSVMSDKQAAEFEHWKECNFAMSKMANYSTRATMGSMGTRRRGLSLLRQMAR